MSKQNFVPKIRIPCVSTHQIFHDLEDCITSSNTKVEKRLQRLRVVCMLMGIEPDIYISHLKICEEESPKVTLEEVQNFLSRPLPLPDSQTILFDHEPGDDKAKKLVESQLTSKLNSDLTLYKITCGIVSRLFCKIKRHPIFRELVKNKQIILVHKGGIAQRLVLLSEYPEHEELIKKYFGFGGDNDCNFIIDPLLENYEEIYKILVDFIWDFIMKEVDGFSYGVVNAYASAFNSIELFGEKFKVTLAERHHFVISNPNESIVYPHMDINQNAQTVFATKNETLSFLDEKNRLCKFTLERFKKAFKVGERLVGAEILDISISHKDETKAAVSFHHYKSGQWVKEIFL